MKRSLWLTVVLLLWGITWSLSHGYLGIRHDAVLYTLQALAHIGKEGLANDVFLRFGSQDQYSIFGSIYALASRALGLEPAAAILTLTSQLAVWLCAGLLLRRISPDTTLTLSGLSVLITIPGYYGADRIFSCIEPFLTPRMGAEALVLASLAAAFNGRPRLACGLVALGALIHPIMAAAGITALWFFYVGVSRPLLGWAVPAAGAVLLAILAAVMPQGNLGAFDPEWLALVRERDPYVFLASWTADDWGRAAVPLATLAIGACLLAEKRARLLCQITLCTAVAGLLLTLLACDGLKLVRLTQLQPWRWQWLAVAVAALTLPSITATAWNRGSAGRVTVGLLVAAWLFGSDEFALITALGALACLSLSRYSSRTEVRWLVYGALALASGALLLRVASSLLFLEVHFADPKIPLWIRESAALAGDGALPVALVILTTWLAQRARGGLPGVALLGALALTLAVLLVPDTWRQWSTQRFPTSLVAQFAPWRALIPPGSQVFWSESPLETWVLLERPSYLSVAQTSGMLFSRPSAMELQRRAQALSGVVPANAYLDFSGDGAGLGPSTDQLQRACATSEFEFLITGAKLSWQPISQLPAATWHASGGLRLYRCSQRHG